MKLRAFTVVWGGYVDFFERGCLASCLWPLNLQTLRHDADVWDIFTAAADVPRIEAVTAALRIPVQCHIVPTDRDPALVFKACLIEEMRRCVHHNQALLMAVPDSIFGDGTLETLLMLGQPKDVCIAVPHVRVEAEAFLETFDGAIPLDNPALVAASFAALHKTWVEADADRRSTNSFCSGVSWRALGRGLYSVSHRLPTAFLVKPLPSDIEFFVAQKYGGAYDHVWPSKLVKEQRHRVVGSSDAAFVAELTLAAENHPPERLVVPGEPDYFNWEHEHNVVNRNTVSIFRARDAS